MRSAPVLFNPGWPLGPRIGRRYCCFRWGGFGWSFCLLWLAQCFGFVSYQYLIIHGIVWFCWRVLLGFYWVAFILNYALNGKLIKSLRINWNLFAIHLQTLEINVESFEITFEITFESFQITFESFQITFKSFQIIFQSFQIIFQSFQIILESFEIILESFQINFESFEITFESSSINFESFRICPNGFCIITNHFQKWIILLPTLWISNLPMN